MAEDKKGYVYILSNPAMPGLVKIGKTGRAELDQRMNELYSTGVPLPFKCEFAAKVNVEDCRKIESALHTAFAPQRVNENREFFRILPIQAKVILELFHHEDATQEVSDEINNDLTNDDVAAVAKSQKHRPPLNYYEMGLKDGDILQWVDDPQIFVTIISDRKVMFDNEEWSISSLSARLKGSNAKHIAPCAYWTYNDRVLSEIYDETYPIED